MSVRIDIVKGNSYIFGFGVNTDYGISIPFIIPGLDVDMQ